MKQTIGLKRTFGYALEGTLLAGAGGATRLLRVTHFDGDKITTAEANVPEAMFRDHISQEAAVARAFATMFTELALELTRKAERCAQ